MQKRAEELKGQLKIASVPEKGTTITFSVPYPFKIPNTWDKKGNGMN
jgi:nitrate/nitrite-specific signal transduction histidine kinase